MTGVGSASRSRDEASSYHRPGYDVFLSFRGEDIREDFTNHLIGALDQVGVKTFVNSEELPQGKELLDTQIEAIRSSKIAIVVFSENYANSRCCLYELTEIVGCMKTEGLLVLPVFYDVDRRYVPFVQPELNYKKEVGRWTVALEEASSFSGYMINPNKTERHLKYIVRYVLSALKYTCFQSPANLVVTESAAEFQQLPLSLKNLVVEKCKEIVKLPPLPPNLLHLDVKSCTLSAEISQLPTSLQKLYVERCNWLLLPPMPTSLQSLHVKSCDGLVELPQLPPRIEDLDVEGCSRLPKLPPMPASLQSLHVKSCDGLVELPQLPPRLEDLDVEGCSRLTKLPPLPASLQSLHVKSCDGLVELPQLPPRIEDLDVEGCSWLPRLPPMPATLQSLHVKSCYNLVELP